MAWLERKIGLRIVHKRCHKLYRDTHQNEPRIRVKTLNLPLDGNFLRPLSEGGFQIFPREKQG